MTVALAIYPTRAQEMLERERVTLAEAAEFLGICRNLSYRYARTYLNRVAPLLKRGVIDISQLRPRINPRTGSWGELPAYMVGGVIKVRTDLLVPMVYPEVSWPC